MGMQKVGWAEETINPAVPVSLAGYFNRRPWAGVHLDVKVRAACFSDGVQTASLLVYDLVQVGKAVRAAVGNRAAGRGLDPEMVFQVATHTHTAPYTGPDMEGWSNPEYNDFLVERADACLAAARADLAEVSESGSAVIEGPPVSFNRRYWMRNGSVVTNPGKLNPDIVGPEGPLDREIGVLRLRRRGRPQLFILNIVNHSDTTGGNLVSPDWPGNIALKLPELVGEESGVMTLVGAAGNINHFDVSSAREQTSPEESRRIGFSYARAVAEGLGALKPIDLLPIAGATETILADPRKLTPEELERFRIQAAREIGTERDLTSEDLARNDPDALAVMARDVIAKLVPGARVEMDIGALRLGRAAFVFLPGEPFVEIGLGIKKSSPAKLTFVSELNRDDVFTGSYVPNPENFPRGGYETHPRSSPHDRNLALVLGKAAAGMLAGLFR